LRAPTPSTGQFGRDPIHCCLGPGWQIDPSKLKITVPEVLQKLADSRPIGIGNMGAGASGRCGRNPDAAACEQRENHLAQRDPNSSGFPP